MLVFIMAIDLACAAVQAASYKVLYSFPTNSDPSSTLVQGKDGAFYGTTFTGGSEGYGTIYRVTAEGGFTNVFSFSYTNGAFPSGPLLIGEDGALYGTTRGGGPIGWYGTVFRMSPEGGLKTVACFGGTNGANPLALTRGRDGFFYGTTICGGAYTNRSIYADGTVFRVSTNGVVTSLASFDGTNGWAPYAGVIEGRDGAFYGTATYGGTLTDQDTNGCGTVFRVTTDGKFRTLFAFAGTNGMHPMGPLVEGQDGLLYGTAASGGPKGGGTVFRISTAGEFSTVAAFDGASGSTALYPAAGLVAGRDGAFYGTTTQGYIDSERYGGSIFRVTPEGLLSRMYSFAYVDGRWSDAALVQGSDGAFYGTCIYGGGPENGGTVFRIDVATRMLPLERLMNGMTVSFSGLPGTGYTIQRAGEATGPWTGVATAVPGTNGVAAWRDVTAPPERGFYRVEIP